MTMQGTETLSGDARNAFGLDDVVAEITRHISISTQCMLWGKSAGRCEFAGCNKPLWKSSVTQESVNVAQKAHIYSFSARGSRGNEGIPKDELNDISNLMLVCHECHQKLDGPQGDVLYTAMLLREMKSEHEERIGRITGIVESKKSQILLYGANVGDHSSPLSYQEAAPALFPERYPTSDAPIELSTVNSSFSDRDPEFWRIEAENLRRKFENRVRERLALGEVDHLSVFSLAPQPLLILLGTLLGDIVPSDVYQRHREPPTWKWPRNLATQEFELREPITASGTPALVLASSATVVEERITSLLGRDASIWIVTFLWFRNSSMGIDRSRAMRTSSLYFAAVCGSAPRRDNERFFRSSTAALKLWTVFRARRRRRARGESAYVAQAMTEAIESKQTRTTIKLIETQFSPSCQGAWVQKVPADATRRLPDSG
jgi:hypothetical protein